MVKQVKPLEYGEKEPPKINKNNKMSVEFKGKEYTIKKKGGLLTLNLSMKKIKSISEIKGLESLNKLQVLNLSNNSIFEIEGLESLNELQVLKLSYNAIFEIEGLETLKNLRELHLDSNRIVKIKGLEALKDLKFLNLAANSISEIGGLDTLTNLEKLYLESNNIEIIKGLDTLENLRTLRLEGNMIAKVESFQNKVKLYSLLFSGNPLYEQVKEMFGTSNAQNLMEFSQMSDSEIFTKAQIIGEKNREQRLAQEIQERKRIIIMANNKSVVWIILGLIGGIMFSISVSYLLGTLVYAFGFGWLGASVSIADILRYLIPTLIGAVLCLISYFYLRS